MEHKITKKLLYDSFIRALWTFMETLLGSLTVGTSLFEFDWITTLGVSLTTSLISFLKSMIVGTPESKVDGKFIIDDTDPEKTLWTLEYNGDPTQIKQGDNVLFEVTSKGGDNDATLG